MSSTNISTLSYQENSRSALLAEFKNPFLVPSIEKVVINIGVGNKKFDSKSKELIYKHLINLVGQKPKKVYTKKSISNFKLRAGDLVGLVVTLRGLKAYNFILNLVYLALPRTRDFKGITNVFDSNNKTYSLGIKSASIFPSIGFGSALDFGMQINITFREGSPNNILLLKKLNFPFSKN
jgi:large subunit ribosomal protein L5